MRWSLIFLMFGLLSVSVLAQTLTQEQIDNWNVGLKTIFDSSGNLIDISKYDYAFQDVSQRFQAMPFPLKAIFNNHRIQINFQLTPNSTKRFGVSIVNEKITSFTLGTVPNATMEVTLSYSTYDALRNGGAADNPKLLQDAIKNGDIAIHTNDFFSGIAISLFRLFI